MKRLHRYICVLFSLLVLAETAHAQNSYFCDFEDPAEQALWTLNPRKSSLSESDFDQIWYRGLPGHCGSAVGLGLPGNGLYISADGGKTVCYGGAHGSHICAYRDLTLTPGTYTLRFDWKFQGKSSDELLVAWVPQTEKCNGGPDEGGLPNAMNNNRITKGKKLNGTSAWQQYNGTFTVPANMSNGRLVFCFWTSQGGASNPAAAVDNIEITQETCSAPTNVSYNKSTGVLSWVGQGNVWDIRYYSYQEGVWYEYNNYVSTTRSMPMNLIGEGYFYFFVRHVCDSTNNIHSAWTTTGSFVYEQGRRCIEYMDLGRGGTKVTGQCYEADFNTYVHTPNRNGNPVAPAPESDSWNNAVGHVLHTNPNEIDPHTSDKGGLKTVPDGEIASVRLGGRQYESTGASCRVVYQYHVQPGVSELLKLKYAVVMQNPNHTEVENPRFTLEILDGNGNKLDNECTQADFRAGFGDTKKWHKDVDEGVDVVWSDWQTITVSLRNYVNQTLTIRLTSIRCIYDTHYSYVYYTLGCESGDFEGIACGDWSVDKFIAPEGFDYRWRKASDPDQRILGTDQVFNIDLMDTAVYTVDLVSLLNKSCYYTLTANPNPRFPISNAHLLPSADSVSVRNCQYHVKFSNDAYVALVNRLDTSLHERTMEAVDGVYWDFGDGSDIVFTEDTVVEHIYGPEGGTYWMRCYVTMSDSACTTVWDSVKVELPRLNEPGWNRIRYGCNGVPVIEDGVEYWSDTILYTPRIVQPLGCEVIDTTRIMFFSSYRDTTYQAICEHTSFTFEGQTFSKEGLDSVKIVTISGCDSVRYLNLHIIPDVRFALEPLNSLAPFCDDQPSFAIPVTVNTGKYAGAALVPDARAVAAGFKPRYEYPMEEPYSELAEPLDTVYEIPVDTFIRPGYYTFLLQSLYRECPVDAVPFNFTLYYSSKALYQKDGYIVLYNPEYNYADYEFSSYRWFRDGVLLPDTKSYIQPTDSDYQHIYQIELIPAGDSVGVMSCPLVYTGQFTPHRPIQNIRSSVSPSVVRTGEPLYVTGEGDARIYDALGRLVMTAPVDSENPVSIPAPQRGGMYVVLIQNDAYRVLVH